MRIGIYKAPETPFPDKTIKSIKKSFKDADINVVNSNNKIGPVSSSPLENDLDDFVNKHEIIINMISGKDNYSTEYSEISQKYKIDIFKAENLMRLIRTYEAVPALDLLAEVLKDNTDGKLIINTGDPVDIITLYLHKAHNINSYGISRKADNLVSQLLKELGLENYIGKVIYSLAGVENSLWLTSIKDKKNKDLYPLLREKVNGLDLGLKRNDLTRDSLRSLKFYGYYHSYSTASESTEAILEKLFAAYKGEKDTIYLNALNNGAIYGLDNEACAEIPFTFKNGIPSPSESELPLQCTLAMTDLASATSLAVKSLATMNREIFIRTVKLDPYLASILNLKELHNLAIDILEIEKEVALNLEGGQL